MYSYSSTILAVLVLILVLGRSILVLVLDAKILEILVEIYSIKNSYDFVLSEVGRNS